MVFSGHMFGTQAAAYAAYREEQQQHPMKKRIVMIGPVYPYKGGISHYTGLMVKNLKQCFSVDTVSYQMQYPKLLFKKEQRDYQNKSFQVEDAVYWIHTANPFNILRCAKKIRALNPDYVIFQWWHPYFAPCYRILEGRLKGIPLLFVCHNVFPHERFPMDRKLTKMVLKKGSAFITHSKMDADDLKTIVSDPIYETTVLPTYNAFRIRGISKEEGRTEIQMAPEKKMLLFFGLIREYKGLKHLVRAMPEITAYDPEIELMVVGEFGSEEERAEYEALIQSTGVSDHIHLIGGYVPDQEVEKYFAAADLVVLPYESATQSAVAQIAYGFEKPVIVTNVGGLPEVVRDGKTGYVVEPKNPAAIAEAVIRYFRENREAEFSAHVREEADRYSWERMNEVVCRLTQRLDQKNGNTADTAAANTASAPTYKK